MYRQVPLKASNQKVKLLRGLVNSRKARSSERAFVVDGPVLVEELFSSDLHCISIFVEESSNQELLAKASNRGIGVHVVESGVLGKVLDPINPRPVAAIAQTPRWSFEQLGSAAVIVLVNIQEPGNLGGLVRTAEAAGLAGVVLSGDCVDHTNPKAVRASAGALFRLPIVQQNEVSEAFGQLRNLGRKVLTTTVVGGRSYRDVDLKGCAFVLGNEAKGLPDSVVSLADSTITIPLAGPTESLNVGTAGALIAFEAMR